VWLGKLVRKIVTQNIPTSAFVLTHPVVGLVGMRHVKNQTHQRNPHQEWPVQDAQQPHGHLCESFEGVWCFQLTWLRAHEEEEEKVEVEVEEDGGKESRTEGVHGRLAAK